MSEKEITLNTTKLHEYAQPAQASYAYLQGLTTTSSDTDVQAELLRIPNRASQFAHAEAKQLTDKYAFVTQYTDVGSGQGNRNGFSATVFRDKLKRRPRITTRKAVSLA